MFACYTYLCITYICALCALNALCEFYLYFVYTNLYFVLYRVFVVCIVPVCVLGELGQIVTADRKEDVDTLATYQTLRLHIHPWRLQTALIMRLSMKDDILNALCICVMCGSACMCALTHIKC